MSRYHLRSGKGTIANKNIYFREVSIVYNFIQLVNSSRPIRFLLVGFLNTLFGYGLFAGLVYLSVPYLVALLLATVVGVLVEVPVMLSLVAFTNRTKKHFQV